MVRRFEDLVNKAETGRKSAIRALQAWQYLIAKAVNRQIVRYDELRKLMGYSDNRPLNHILGCIMYYCQQNDLPPLTLIVVNQKGIPGEGFTAEELKNYHETRERVFNFPWYEIVPPTVDEFEQARIQAQTS